MTGLSAETWVHTESEAKTNAAERGEKTTTERPEVSNQVRFSDLCKQVREFRAARAHPINDGVLHCACRPHAPPPPTHTHTHTASEQTDCNLEHHAPCSLYSRPDGTPRKHPGLQGGTNKCQLGQNLITFSRRADILERGTLTTQTLFGAEKGGRVAFAFSHGYSSSKTPITRL